MLFDITGERGFIGLGISINASVESVVQSYRRRRHINSTFRQVEQKILKLQEHALGEEEDTCLWKRVNGDFRPGFVTIQT